MQIEKTKANEEKCFSILTINVQDLEKMLQREKTSKYRNSGHEQKTQPNTSQTDNTTKYTSQNVLLSMYVFLSCSA